MKIMNILDLQKIVALFLTCTLFLISGAVISVRTASAEEPKSFQLLENRGIAVLKDTFSDLGNNKDPESKAHLTIKNLTMHSLKVDLNGANGKYHLEINPKSDEKWKITSGEYHFELHVPGLPSASGQMILNSTTAYQWKIMSKQP